MRKILILFLLLASATMYGQRIKLLQLEQKGTPKEGYFGLTNSDGNQRYVAHDSLVTTIITANGHWYLNGADDAFGSTTISPGETVAFTGTGGSGFTGIIATLAASGSNTLLIDGSSLQWNLGANGSYTVIGNVSGSSESVNFVGSGIVSTSRSSNTITISATEVDGSTTNEIDTWDLGANGSYTTIGNGEQVNFVGATGITTSRTGNTIMITGSSSLSGSGTTNYVTKWTSSTTLGNSAIQDNGSTVSIGGALDASYELFIADGSVKIGDAAGELNKIYFGDGSFVYVGEHGADDRLYLRGSTLSVDIGGSLGSSGYVLTSNGSTATWAAPASGYSGWDLGANASYTTISSGEQVNFVGSGIASTSRSGNQITVTATEVDGSTTNEIQGLDFFNASSPVTLYADGSADGAMFVAGSGISLSMASDQLTISATEVDGSVTNEAQTWSNSGTTSYTGTLSTAGGAGGGSFTIAAGSNVSVSHSAGTVTIAASFTEVDGSTTNEIDEWDLGANGSYTTISDGEQVNFVGAGIASTSRSTNTITITATEVDGSVTNEAQTWSNSGTTSYTGTLSTAGGAGGGSFTISAGSNVSVSHSAGTVTIAASFTEVDGSTTNEIDEWDLGANGSYTTISDGEQVNFVGAGIASTSRSANTITITATEVDGSVTNEINDLTFTGSVSGSIFFNNNLGTDVTINLGSGLSFTGATASSGTLTLTEVDGSVTNEAQTWSNSGTTSYTGTLSTAGGAGGGAFTISAGSNVTVSHSAGTVTIAASGGATDLTFTGSGPFTLNSSTGSDVTFTEGSNIDITRTSNDLSFKATPAGSNTYIQYNSSGSFGAEAALSYNTSTNVLTSGNYIATDLAGAGTFVVFADINGKLDITNNYTGGWNYFSTTRGGFVGDFHISSATSTTYDDQFVPVFSMQGDNNPGWGILTGNVGGLQTISSSTSIGDTYVYVDVTSSGVTVTIPESADGRVIWIRNRSGGNITLDPESSGSIDGSSTKTMADGTFGFIFKLAGVSGAWRYFGT